MSLTVDMLTIGEGELQETSSFHELGRRMQLSRMKGKHYIQLCYTKLYPSSAQQLLCHKCHPITTDFDKKVNATEFKVTSSSGSSSPVSKATFLTVLLVQFSRVTVSVALSCHLVPPATLFLIFFLPLSIYFSSPQWDGKMAWPTSRRISTHEIN